MKLDEAWQALYEWLLLHDGDDFDPEAVLVKMDRLEGIHE